MLPSSAFQIPTAANNSCSQTPCLWLSASVHASVGCPIVQIIDSSCGRQRCQLAYRLVAYSSRQQRRIPACQSVDEPMDEFINVTCRNQLTSTAVTSIFKVSTDCF